MLASKENIEKLKAILCHAMCSFKLINNSTQRNIREESFITNTYP